MAEANERQDVIDCSDKATIDRLYSKMARAAIAKAQSVVGRGDVAAEIAHDSFIKLWQGGGQFPSEKAIYAWIFKTCHRAAIDHLRSAAHRREDYNRDDDTALDFGVSSRSGDHGDQLMTRELVTRYLRVLKPDEAEAFLYVTLDGMTQAEVVEIMGLSRRTVQRLLERAEAKFREARAHAE